MKGLLSLAFAYVYALAVSQDYSLDKKLGEENSKQVEQEMGIYSHDSLQWLFTDVGQQFLLSL
jgi:oxalate decarboxylase/phosphoglucose isomerase-like protein (cupin superfamily)